MQLRRQKRELLITTAEIAESIKGFIVFDETVRQRDAQGRLFVEVMHERGMLPG